MDVESLLPEGYRTWLLWAWVERQDLRSHYAKTLVCYGRLGRFTVAPQACGTIESGAHMNAAATHRSNVNRCFGHAGFPPGQ
ncbi:MAG: hypothetical protein RLY71_4140 [Pseudomonadota bacterium]|jgi:hypothetical protein